jgi:hypothetical protein
LLTQGNSPKDADKPLRQSPSDLPAVQQSLGSELATLSFGKLAEINNKSE